MMPPKKLLVAIVYEPGKQPKRLNGILRETKLINTNAAQPLIYRMNKYKKISYLGFFRMKSDKVGTKK